MTWQIPVEVNERRNLERSEQLADLEQHVYEASFGQSTTRIRLVKNSVMIHQVVSGSGLDQQQ